MNTVSKPNFKTVWTNNVSSQLNIEPIIKQELGSIFSILDMDGVKTMIVEKKNKLHFIDPCTFKALRKPFALGKKDFAAKSYNVINVYTMDGQWFVVYQIRPKQWNDEELFVIDNITTNEEFYRKEIDVFKEAFITIDGENYLFVARQYSDALLVQKLNLRKVKPDDKIEIEIAPENCDLQFIDETGTPILMVKYNEYGEAERHFAFFDTSTCKPIGTKISISQLRSYCVGKIKNVNVLIAINKDNIVTVWDILSGNKTDEFQVNFNDEVNSLNLSFDDSSNNNPLLIIAAYKSSQLINLADEHKKATFFEAPNGTHITYKGFIKTTHNGNTVLVDKHNGIFYAMPNLQTIAGTHPLRIKKDGDNQIRLIEPLSTSEGKEVYLISYGYYDDDSIYALWNPNEKGKSLADVTRHNNAVSTYLNNKAVVITTSTDGVLHIFDATDGKEIQTSQPNRNLMACSQLLVTQLGNETVLLALLPTKIQAFSLSTLNEIAYCITLNNAIENIAIATINGKPQIVGANTHIYTWELETGTLLHNPLRILVDKQEAKEGAESNDPDYGYITADGLWLHCLDLGVTQKMLISTASSDAYLWDLDTSNKKEVKSLLVDKTAWNKVPEQADYVIKWALVAKIEGEDVIVAMNQNGIITMHNAATHQQQGAIMYHPSATNMAIASHNGNSVLITAATAQLQMWDLKTAKTIQTIDFKDNINTISVLNNTLIVCHGEDITAIEITE